MKVDPGESLVQLALFCALYVHKIVCIYKLVYFAVVFKFGTGLTIVTIYVLSLRGLDQAYMIFCGKTITAHSQLP
jgi:hypothetical protein